MTTSLAVPRPACQTSARGTSVRIDVELRNFQTLRNQQYVAPVAGVTIIEGGRRKSRVRLCVAPLLPASLCRLIFQSTIDLSVTGHDLSIIPSWILIIQRRPGRGGGGRLGNLTGSCSRLDRSLAFNDRACWVYQVESNELHGTFLGTESANSACLQEI